MIFYPDKTFVSYIYIVVTANTAEECVCQILILCQTQSSNIKERIVLMGIFTVSTIRAHAKPQPRGTFSDLGRARGGMAGATLRAEYKLLFGPPVNYSLSFCLEKL